MQVSGGQERGWGASGVGIGQKTRGGRPLRCPRDGLLQHNQMQRCCKPAVLHKLCVQATLAGVPNLQGFRAKGAQEP